MQRFFIWGGGFNSILPEKFGNHFAHMFRDGVYTLKPVDENPAIIFVNHDLIYYFGSNEGTLFLLVDKPRGVIRGGIKQDIVDLDNLKINENWNENRMIHTDFVNNVIVYIVEFEESSTSAYMIIHIFDVEILRGRSKTSEVIYTRCETEFIDGRGGGDLIVGSPEECSDKHKETRIVNHEDIHYFDSFKTVTYDIQPNASIFLTHDKSKNMNLNFPQIIILNEKFSNLTVQKIYFDKVFYPNGELYKYIIPDSQHINDLIYQGYIITSKTKRILIDSYGANIIFRTIDNYQFSIYETSLQDHFDDIVNQFNYEYSNFFDHELYKKIIEKHDMHGLKFNLIKSINATIDKKKY